MDVINAKGASQNQHIFITTAIGQYVEYTYIFVDGSRVEIIKLPNQITSNFINAHQLKYGIGKRGIVKISCNNDILAGTMDLVRTNFMEIISGDLKMFLKYLTLNSDTYGSK